MKVKELRSAINAITKFQQKNILSEELELVEFSGLCGWLTITALDSQRMLQIRMESKLSYRFLLARKEIEKLKSFLDGVNATGEDEVAIRRIEDDFWFEVLDDVVILPITRIDKRWFNWGGFLIKERPLIGRFSMVDVLDGIKKAQEAYDKQSIIMKALVENVYKKIYATLRTFEVKELEGSMGVADGSFVFKGENDGMQYILAYIGN